VKKLQKNSNKAFDQKEKKILKKKKIIFIPKNKKIKIKTIKKR
jgi:hypothetical protein